MSERSRDEYIAQFERIKKRVQQQRKEKDPSVYVIDQGFTIAEKKALKQKMNVIIDKVISEK